MPEKLSPEPSIKPLLDERKRNRKKASPKNDQQPAMMFNDQNEQEQNISEGN